MSDFGLVPTVMIGVIIGLLFIICALKRPEVPLIAFAILLPSGNFVTKFRLPLEGGSFITAAGAVSILTFCICIAVGKFQIEWRKSAGIPIAGAFILAGILAAIGSN